MAADYIRYDTRLILLRNVGQGDWADYIFELSCLFSNPHQDVQFRFVVSAAFRSLRCSCAGGCLSRGTRYVPICWDGSPLRNNLRIIFNHPVRFLNHSFSAAGGGLFGGQVGSLTGSLGLPSPTSNNQQGQPAQSKYGQVGSSARVCFALLV